MRKRFLFCLVAALLQWPAANGAGGDDMHCPQQLPAFADAPTAQFQTEPLIPANELRAEFDHWLDAMAAHHPDYPGRVNIAAIEAKAAALRSQLDRPITRREAFLIFAQLNPLLRDGHLGVLYPDYRGALERHIAAGGRIAPVEIRFDPEGEPRIFSASGGDDAPKKGARLVAINGVPADEIAQRMLDRAIGDTLAFRRAFVARRFASFYWLLYGDTGIYDVATEDEAGCLRTASLPGATRLPVSLQSAPPPHELFERRMLAGGVAYLRAASFSGEYQGDFEAFARASFAMFKEEGAKALIIDVRDNGGGDDPMWQLNLMEYITDEPYAHLSRYAVRVTEKNADPGDVIGEVQRKNYTDRFTPSSENLLRFTGPVYILAGPYTYSAAVQFVVAAQDYGVAAIAGEAAGARACQTGQVSALEMPLTGLNAFAPTIAYWRPSGKGCMAPVTPDAPLPVNEIFPDQTLEALRRAVLERMQAAP